MLHGKGLSPIYNPQTLVSLSLAVLSTWHACRLTSQSSLPADYWHSCLLNLDESVFFESNFLNSHRFTGLVQSLVLLLHQESTMSHKTSRSPLKMNLLSLGKKSRMKPSHKGLTEKVIKIQAKLTCKHKLLMNWKQQCSILQELHVDTY